MASGEILLDTAGLDRLIKQILRQVRSSEQNWFLTSFMTSEYGDMCESKLIKDKEVL